MADQLLVLGWDAATRAHLDRFDLDFFDALPHGGPLLPEPYWQSREVDSGTAWTTITTGLSMWDHRVATLGGTIGDERLFRAFSAVDRLVPRNLAKRPARIWARSKVLGDQPTNDDVPFKRVWHYVPNSLSFAVPLTYPPKPTDGVTVSGFPSPEVTVQPPELQEWVRERYDGEPKKFDDDGQFRESYVEDLFETHRTERELVRDLQEERAFDHQFVVFTLLDRLLHATDDDDRIREAYELVDETSRRLVDAIDPDDVMIISDHGMRYDPRGKWVHVHDERSGIWAGTTDFGLETHLDVTPAILDYYDASMDDPSYAPPASATDDDEVLQERLNDLGYL
jgi:hypothetical protein